MSVQGNKWYFNAINFLVMTLLSSQQISNLKEPVERTVRVKGFRKSLKGKQPSVKIWNNFGVQI